MRAWEPARDRVDAGDGRPNRAHDNRVISRVPSIGTRDVQHGSKLRRKVRPRPPLELIASDSSVWFGSLG